MSFFSGPKGKKNNTNDVKILYSRRLLAYFLSVLKRYVSLAKTRHFSGYCSSVDKSS